MNPDPETLLPTVVDSKIIFALTLRCQLTLLLLISSPAVVLAWQAPLSSLETQIAAKLVTEADGQKPRAAIADSKRNADNKPILGREVLLIETLYRKKKSPRKAATTNRGQVISSAPRVAEAFVFDYSSGRTMRYLIDVGTSRMLDEQAVDSIHLPLNQREQELATALIFEDVAVAAAINAEFIREYGKAPQFNDDIDTKVFIWQPTPGDTSPLAIECRQQRCAWVSMFTRTSLSLSVEPVVNLMRQQVYLRSTSQ